ncbi:GspH/FimT family pseudopilin [Aliamphritea spongicola]|uniref:GspH/FimT family pseudopilin n=1 Tax=Aliamphritea spongicola TaxID=707589 RepID=UPI00196A490C|nr:GspH/FimT family pseudopilin [Aliamphritea spongicola]MBN3562478.1 GspH/FimT family pseudopilin [Aliamphritea spongicola]
MARLSSTSNSVIRCSTGFTLLELMVAIAILGILLGIGIPSYNAMTESTRLRSVTHNLTTAAQLARSEAINRRDTTAVCRANVGFTACSFANDWSNGWVVVEQTGANLQVAADVDVIRTWDAVDIVVSGAVNGFVFNRSGRATTTGQLRVQNDTDSRCLFVNGSGRVAGADCP